MPVTPQKLSSSSFDSNNGNNGSSVQVTSSSAWTRVLTLSVDVAARLIGLDVACSGNPVKIRFTRATIAGKTHGLIQTDMTQAGRSILMATVNGTGTVNQLNAGDIGSYNINPEGCAEVGVECQATAAGTATVEAYGKYEPK